MRRSYLLVLLCLSILPFAFPGCSKPPDFWAEAKPSQKKILVSFPPLYCLTHAIAGDDAYVLCMLTGHGPHDYDGGPTDLFKVNKADLFIYNGLTLDDLFVEKMVQHHKNKGLVLLNVGEVMEKDHHALLLHFGAHEHEHDKDKKEHPKEDPHAGHDHKHGEHDPHIWLGPKQAIAMSEIIAAKLADIDPEHKKGYEARAKKLAAELKKLQEYGDEKFKNKKDRKIITMHEAFGYFADNFDIDIEATIQQKPGMDPDAGTMARLVKLCREEKIAVIAVEPQYSKAQAEALQSSLKRDKLDVQIVTLDPLETAPVAEGKKNPDPGYYLKKMKENIDTLAKALP